MEVQVAWLETKLEESKLVESQTAVEVMGSPDDLEDEAPDDYAVPVSRRHPPRLPGAMRTLVPMPVLPSRPPPPPRRITQEVEMSWVEIVDENLTVDDIPELRDTAEYGGTEADEPLPVLQTDDDGEPEMTRVEEGPLSTQRILAERVAAREASEKAESDGAERMREEVLAARLRDQNARDKELRETRKAERARERLAQEASSAKVEEENKEEASKTAVREGRQQKEILDLSGIDDEIDSALDSVLGPNLSYPPPPPDSNDAT